MPLSKSFQANFSWFPLFSGFSIMDRYILTELTLPFLFGVGAFSSIGVAIGSLFELVRKVAESGLLMSLALKVLLLKMPEFIVYAFPMSALLATMMAYGRFSSDSELTALRSVGISVYRIVLPAIIFSLAVTGLTFVFNEVIVPNANYQATLTLDRALGEEKPSFQEKNILYPEYSNVQRPEGEQEVLTRLFYAEKFDGTTMEGLTLLDRSQEGVEQIVTSESATWDLKDNTWNFFNGTIYLIDGDGSYKKIVRFVHQKLKLPKAPFDLAQKGRDYGEMNIAQGFEQMKILEQSGDTKKLRKLRVRVQQKMAFPFVCLVFGLVGAALGTRPQRASKATSFGMSIVIIFSYYLISFITGAMGIVGAVSPFLSAWLPNFFGLGVGGLLLMRSSKL
ncbi:MAG: LptF/LptG family permease [Spirulinaceae cyanobacterium]